MKKFIALISFTYLLISCSSSQESIPEKGVTGLSYQSGLKIYQERCAVCHGKKGEGLKSLYPPIAHSDYLLKNKDQVPCIIKNGLEGEIVVNGKTFNSVMLAHKDLSDMELADLMTFLFNSWDYSEGEYTKSDIKKLLENCKE